MLSQRMVNDESVGRSVELVESMDWDIGLERHDSEAGNPLQTLVSIVIL